MPPFSSRPHLQVRVIRDDVLCAPRPLHYNRRMADTVITRFAPSPTGALHVGGARTALFNWAYARRHGGKFFLRIEDTDRARSTEAAEEGILRDLDWLGIDWDNQGKEPRQSQRLDLYNAAIEKLRAAGLTTTEENGAVRFTMPNRDITFEDKVRDEVTFPAGQIEDFIIQKAPDREGKQYPTYHLAVVVDDAEMGVTHVLRGQEHLNNTPKHIALQEALGLPRPTYAHFGLIFNPDGSKMSKRDKAKAARAAALEHTTTCDQQQWFDALIQFQKQATSLYPDLPTGTQLTYDNLESFCNKQNDDLSIAKSIALNLKIELPEIDVKDFTLSGYLSTALCNYLALLGWNPGNDVEKFDNNFLAQNFSFDRCNKGDSRFDRDKLASFNADAIKAMNSNTLYQMIWNQPYNHNFFLHKDPNKTFGSADDPKFTTFCETYRERSKTLCDPLTQGAFFFVGYDEIQIDDKARKKVMDKNEGEGWKALEALKPVLEQLPEDGFGAAAHEKIKALAERMGVGMGKLAQPLRVAISGNTVTPPIDATLDILGKDKTLARIQQTLDEKPTC